MRPTSRLALVPAAALLAVAPMTGAGAAPTALKPATVTIKSFAFTPATLKVKVGQKLVVKNADTTTHTLTEGATEPHSKTVFDTKSLAPGKSVTLTLTKAGTYAFHCHIHPSMTGKVVVTR